MDANLFKAAAKGNFEAFERAQHLDQIVTKFKDTILHINIKAPKQKRPSTKFVEQVLGKCPSLLLQVNDEDDTPLIVAAKWGHTTMVGVLIKRAKARHEDIEIGVTAAREMLKMTNKEGNTALHEAARSNCNQVVKLLIKEYPSFSYLPNKAGETPLQIAASRGNVKIVDGILKLSAPDAVGLTDNQTILERKKKLTEELQDQNGWTPLHFAAYYGYIYAAKQLLKFDESAAYIGDKERNMTALHLAASQGYGDIIEVIIDRCPDCYHLIDKRGWNVLHFAMVSLSVKALKRLLRNSLLRSLISEKDFKGNTPLHVLAASNPDSFFYVIEDVRCDWCEGILHHVSPMVKQEILKLSKDTGGRLYPRSVIRTRDETKEKELNRINKNVKQSQMIVATLVATITFAASLNVPGGYETADGPRKGTPVLSEHPAFVIFRLANTSAFMFTVLAVIVNFLVSFDIFANANIVLAAVSFYTNFAVVFAVMPPSNNLMALPAEGMLFFIFILMSFPGSYIIYVWYKEKFHSIYRSPHLES